MQLDCPLLVHFPNILQNKLNLGVKMHLLPCYGNFLNFVSFLQLIFGNVEEKSEQGPSLFSQAAGIFSSLNRFMKAISK